MLGNQLQPLHDCECVQKHKVCLEIHLRSSVTENSVSAGSNFTQSCVLSLPAPCKKKSVFRTLKYDELLSGRKHSVGAELYCLWLWVLSWCFTVCTDGSPTGLVSIKKKSALASLHSPTATLTFLYHGITETLFKFSYKDLFTCSTSFSLTCCVNYDHSTHVSVYKCVSQVHFCSKFPTVYLPMSPNYWNDHTGQTAACLTEAVLCVVFRKQSKNSCISYPALQVTPQTGCTKTGSRKYCQAHTLYVG